MLPLPELTNIFVPGSSSRGQSSRNNHNTAFRPQSLWKDLVDYHQAGMGGMLVTCAPTRVC